MKEVATVVGMQIAISNFAQVHVPKISLAIKQMRKIRNRNFNFRIPCVGKSGDWVSNFFVSQRNHFQILLTYLNGLRLTPCLLFQKIPISCERHFNSVKVKTNLQ